MVHPHIFFKSIPELTLLKSIGQRTLIYYGVHAPIVLVLVEKLVLQLSTRYTGIFCEWLYYNKCCGNIDFNRL